MAKLEIALDLGTSYTTIFASGNGIVLHEPSAIAYFDDGERRRTRAVGNEAYYMMGKAPEKTKIVCPIVDGLISDPAACADMLSEFVDKLMPESYLIRPRVSCVLGVPTGIKVEEREMYEDVLTRAGIGEVYMVNSIMLAALGVDMPISNDFGGLVVSMGGGSTEIAVLSMCGIVTGVGVNIGGDMIEHAIMDAVSGIYRIKIGRAAARRIKENICSLIRNDCASITVSGMDIETRAIRTQTISSEMLYGALDSDGQYQEILISYYKNVVDAVSNVINTCTPTVAAEIEKNGITVVGGGALIPGLKEVMSKLLRLKVRIPREAAYATALGGGKLLSDTELLDDILAHA